jgi:aspartate ammonia-lyase
VRSLTGLPLARAENGVGPDAKADLFSEVSGMLRTVAVISRK